MNSLDLLLLSVLLFPFTLGRTRWRKPFAALMLMGLLAHLTLGLPRWQLSPAYLALSIALLFTLGKPLTRRRRKLSWSLVTVLLVTMAASLIWALPIFHLPVPTGSQAIGTRVVHFKGHQAPLTVQLWYPTKQRQGKRAPYLFDAPVAAGLARSVGLPGFAFNHLRRLPTHAYLNALPAAGRHPTLLFFHGLGGVRQQNTFQIEELASHGYLVVGIDIPGYAAATVTEDGQIIRDTHGSASLSTRLSDKWVQEWATNGSSVLNQLLNHPEWGELIDPDRIGAFGHSFGGATASYLLLTKPRIKAALNMDAGIFGQPLPVKGYAHPFFLMNAQDGLNLGRLQQQARKLSDAEISAATQGQLRTRAAFIADLKELSKRREMALSGPAWSLVLPDTGHLSFSDVLLYSPLLAGGKDVAGTHRAVSAFTLAFFDQELRGKAARLSVLQQHYPALRFHVGKSAAD